MKLAHATFFFFVLWLIASPYWIQSQCVHTLTPHACLSHIRLTHKNKISKPQTKVDKWEEITFIEHIFLLATCPLQAPLVHKWNGYLSRIQGRTPMATNNNIQTFSPCRTTYSRNLDKTFDGVKDIET